LTPIAPGGFGEPSGSKTGLLLLTWELSNSGSVTQTAQMPSPRTGCPWQPAASLGATLPKAGLK
jgi:hypothetical protein